MSAGRTLRIGPDHVIVSDDRLVVISRAHMDAWRIRAHRHAMIKFEGRSWRLVETSAVPPNATRYTLTPWDLSDHDVVSTTIEYGPDYVAVRDHAAKKVEHTRRSSALMRVVAPFTGFLSARTKERLEDKYDIDPIVSSKQSVLIEVMLGFSSLAAMQIFMMTGLPYLPFGIVALALAPDAAVRWSRVLEEQRPPPGFYEWVLRRAERRE
jgi:hypothetical protein